MMEYELAVKESERIERAVNEKLGAYAVSDVELFTKRGPFHDLCFDDWIPCCHVAWKQEIDGDKYGNYLTLSDAVSLPMLMEQLFKERDEAIEKIWASKTSG